MEEVKVMADCKKCVINFLGTSCAQRNCPVIGHMNNAACLMIYKDRDTCSVDQCPTCKFINFCKEKGINLNKDDKES